MISILQSWTDYGPGPICRMDDRLLQGIKSENQIRSIITGCCLAIAAGTIPYGAVFGIWRSARQACYSLLKMPLLIVAVVIVSTLINYMLARVMGADLSMKKVLVAMLVAFAITSMLLGGLSPVALFVVTQVPDHTAPSAMIVYRTLLTLHAGVIGACGIVGNVRLYKLLGLLTGSRALAGRVLAAWILVSGFAGCQLSWLMSPYLARPDMPVPFFNPNAFSSNFYEYLWRAWCGALG